MECKGCLDVAANTSSISPEGYALSNKNGSTARQTRKNKNGRLLTLPNPVWFQDEGTGRDKHTSCLDSGYQTDSDVSFPIDPSLISCDVVPGSTSWKCRDGGNGGIKKRDPKAERSDIGRRQATRSGNKTQETCNQNFTRRLAAKCLGPSSHRFASQFHKAIRGILLIYLFLFTQLFNSHLFTVDSMGSVSLNCDCKRVEWSAPRCGI